MIIQATSRRHHRIYSHISHITRTQQTHFNKHTSTNTLQQTHFNKHTSTNTLQQVHNKYIQQIQLSIMPFRSHRSRKTTTRTTKPSLMTRLRGPNARTKTYKTTTTTTTSKSNRRRGQKRADESVLPHRHHHQKRKVTLGDKLSGAMLKMKGSLTGRPGEKAAGTRRMHGTDGRGSHRRNY
ncbi:hypothetical protein ASPZODRAFT_255053 [Penicilliopsis zonata CBS 506.65]|uniref:Uncharacterized protein n=1 Tax=Penicilliopsis zonata CBS 506.65 TaxID=1073090 RepID=A0A1L9SUN5_9EURO|nr:hypothetical protein ASPZODRAFT_255053 [Penicilliopsis zonata CBS 506.65]OJJ50763.1 hypothetical protein ASPZODRAFT_255053 [Penicilliopsis zonata CBS 506.65]